MTTMGCREILDIEGIRRMQAMKWRLLGRVYTGDTETAHCTRKFYDAPSIQNNYAHTL